MHFLYSPYIVPLFAAGAISVWVAYYAWSHRTVSGASALALLALAVSDWAIGYALEIAGADLATKVWWAKVEYIGTTTIPLLWLVFCYNYFNQNRPMPARVIAGLGLLPLLTLVLVFTTEYHGLIWSRYFISRTGDFSSLGVVHGLWFWIYWIYAYFLLLIGTYFIIRLIRRKHGLYRWQIIALIVAAVAPWVGNFLYVSGLTPVANLDLTSYGFTVAVVSIAWGIFRLQLINLLPLARDTVVDEMEDGMIVLDARGRVADINPAAAAMIGFSITQAIGRSAVELFGRWPALTKKYEDVLDAFEEISVGEGESQRWFELSLAPLRNKDKTLVGRLITLHDITKRRQVDERLLQLSRAVEASPASIVITDVSGQIQYVNPKFTAVTGYTLQDALGNNPRILKTDQTPPEVHRQLWETILAGKEWHGEFCNRKKNGELYWETASISPIIDADGKIINFVAVKEDITEHRRMQAQLQVQNRYLTVLHEITLDLLNRRELDDLLRAIVNHAADLLHSPYREIMLKEGNELVVHSFTPNQGFLSGERVGRDIAKLAWQAHDAGQPVILEDYSTWADRRTTDDPAPWSAVAEFPVMVGQRCVAVIGIGRSRPGQLFTPEEIQTGILFSRLVGLVLDNINLYTSAMQEIAERKRTESLLQESEARYRQIVETANDLIYRTDAQGHILYVNPTSLRLFGLDRIEDILGKSYLDFIIPDWREKVRRLYVRQFLSGESNTYFEVPVLTLDGHELWLGQNVQVIRDDGRVVGFQAVARDITAIKQAQEALAIARDQAQEANHLKSDLLARVSHELRTPLSGILGYAELLRDNTFGPLSEDQRRVAKTIVESSEYLTNMINDLLDQAQIDAKKLVLRFSECSPADLLGGLKEIMAVSAQKKGLTLRTVLEPDAPVTVYSDPQRLRQILINLVANAIKFTKQGEVSIRILGANPTHWALQVSDTGIGIPEESQAIIFEPFQKVDSSLTGRNRGFGLGLSITKQLVDLMGGQLELASKVGEGTTFLVTLPINKR
ncbi:MAG TPA: PAS domain S-box protein [Anaerolineales bacterium]|nr:PAS domain S-box protein [Anaerolineales bacterium]